MSISIPKMDTQILKVVGQVAGIGGIAIGMFLLVFREAIREAIRKNIVSKLTEERSYQLMRLTLVLVWSVALAGIIAYAYVTIPPKHTEDVFLNKEKPQEFEFGGEVRDEKGEVEGVRISVKDATTFSGKDGAFNLKVKGQPGERFELRADKQGYQHWQEGGVEARSGIAIILQRR